MAHTQILSVVLALGPQQADPTDLIIKWHGAASRIKTEFELVVIANGLTPHVVRGLRSLAATLSNLQVYVFQIPRRVQIARFAGLEHAVGDWVAIVNPASDPPELLSSLFEAAIQDGTDLAVAVDHDPHFGWPLSVRLMSWGYHKLFRALHGFRLSQPASSTRLISRSVVNAILQHDYPLVALDILPFASGYRCSVVQYQKCTLSTADPLIDRVGERWQTLIGINAVPLRVANALCGLGAIGALAYSVYVALIYFLKDSVAPGWTTLSLLITGMFLLISLVLWFLSEYIILLLDAGARRARYEVAEEFGSNIQTYRQRLNVESEG